MGAFDPDAYLSKPKGFDPDAYLASGNIPPAPEQSNMVRQPYPGEMPGGPKFVKDAIPEQRVTWSDRLAAIPDVAATMIGGTLSSIAAPYVAAGSEILSGKLGTKEGAAIGKAAGEKVAKAVTYTPQTQTGKAIVENVGEALAPYDLAAIPFAQGAVAGAFVPAATRQVANVAKREGALAKEAIQTGLNYGKDANAVANMAKSFENAGQIEAAQFAQKHGILLNPDVSNPTAGSRIRGAIVGDQNISDRMAAENKPKWTAVAKADVGIPEARKLDAQAFEEAHANPSLTKPYETARAVPNVAVDQNAVVKRANALKASSTMGDTAEAAGKLNSYIDEVTGQIVQGGDGNRFVDGIRKLRKDAQDIYAKKDKEGGLSIAERDIADAKMGLANIIEDQLLDSLPIKDRDAFLKAREGQAKLYQLQQATNLATGEVDPKAFAKMIQDNRPITGNMRELGLIAANFPDVVTPGGPQKWSTRILRSTPGGLIGGTIGFAMGGGVGAPIGAAIGTAAGELGKKLIAKNMLSAEYQARHAVPTDYRPSGEINALRAMERPVTPGQSNLAVYDYRNQTVLPPENQYQPNWVFGQPPVEPVRTPPAGPAQLPAPSPTSTLASIASEEARRTRMARMAEAEVASVPQQRAPTRGGTVYEVDPVSGKLVPASQGIKGATPETFQNYMSTLKSATDKLSAGQGFSLSAAEKVAFDKTRVDLAEVMPGFKALTDKAIAERMMDRSWVQDAVNKAREKAAAFEAIMQRSKDAEAVVAARAARERMMDVADMMEESLRQLRPDTSRKQQGPKTRNAIRNNLIKNNRNKLSD